MTQKVIPFRSLLILFIGLLTQSFTSYGQTDSFKTEVETTYKAFKTKDYSLLKPILDKNVTIGNLPKGLNDAIIPQILNQLPEPTSYEVSAIEATDSGIWVKTEYTYKNGMKRPQNFLFNKDRKIINFDVLSGATTMTAQAPQPKSDQLIPHFEMDFEVKHGIILTKANLNGRPMTFIFDSGSPTLIINSDVLNQKEISQSQAAALGVGGTAQLGVAKINEFQWGKIVLKDFQGLCMPLKHLQKPLRKKIAGLIGYTLFSDYQLTFDYAKNKLYFDLTDDSGKLVSPDQSNHEDISKATVLNFEQFQHIPVITIRMNAKDYRMGLDCGASQNLLMAQYYNSLATDKNIRKRRSRKMRGAGTESAKVKTAIIKEVLVNGLPYDNMPFAFEDQTLDQLRSGYHLDIDGLLGYPFFKKYTTIINYKAKKIFILK